MERFAGRFGLLKLLGRGGMGEVHLAVELESGAEYALKRLPKRDPPLDPALLQREFAALARIGHPAVVRVVELAFDFEGAPFLVMEYVPGYPADQVVRPGDWEALIFVAARVASGLEALHAAGIAHGDLKPSNLLVVPPSGGGLPRDVRIVDFGLAGLMGADAEGHRGTVGFTAPEVVRGAVADRAADLYALGASLYALACGRVPFEGPDPDALLQRQQAGAPSALPLEEAGAPGELTRLILRLMAPAPGERPASARDVRHTLEGLSPSARWPLIERLRSERLAGRDAEQTIIERAWRRAAKGARVVVVSGEPGIGKSALLAAVATRGTLEGRSVIRVSGAESPEPGATLRTVLRRLAAEARVPLPPGLAAGPGGESTPRTESGASSLAALLDSASEWCRIVSARSAPPGILLDDAALDPLSRRSLRRLMLRGAAAPALWVWVRGGEGDDERLLVTAGAAESLPLEPLPREALVRLVASRLNCEPPASLMDFLWERTSGHPGWTVELLGAAAAANALVEDDSGVRVDSAALAALRVPHGFEAARLDRLATLPAEARAAAELLAAGGRAHPLAQLRRADPALAPESLAVLGASGLALRDADGAWRLTPPSLATQVLESLSAERRVALHRALLSAGDLGAVERFRHLSAAGDAGEALAAAETAFAEALDPALAVEAADLAEPRDPAAAARWLDRAAQVLMDRGRYAAATPLVERALGLDGHSSERGRRWGMLTTCRFRTGDLDGVARAGSDARKEPFSDAALAVVLTNEAARKVALGDLAGARPLAAEAVDRATRAGDDRALGNALLTQVSAMTMPDRVSQGEALVQRAIEAFSRAGYGLGEVRGAAQSVRLLADLGQHEKAESALESAIARARREQLSLPLENLLLTLAHYLLAKGRWREAREAQAESVRVAMEEGHASDLALGVMNLAVLDALLGELRSARVQVRRAARLATAHDPKTIPGVQRTRAMILRTSGQLLRATAWAERAVATAQQLGARFDLVWARIELARITSLRGRWSAAEGAIEAALTARDGLEPNALAALTILGGRAAIRRGDLVRARSLLESAEVQFRDKPIGYGSVFLEQLRTLIAFAAREERRALDGASQVLRQLDALHAVPDRAAAALEFARVAMELGIAAEDSGRWLDLAVADFERIGDRRGRERALALLVELLRRRGATAIEPGRERDLIERVGRLLDSLSDPVELIQRAMELVVQHFSAERGVLLLVDPETGRLEPRAEHGAMDAGTRRDAATYSRRVVEQVAESGGSLLIPDAPTDPRLRSESVMNLGLRSIVCVPLYHGGKVIGAVYLDDSRRRDAFVAADRGLLEGFAQLMAVAIENSRGNEEVRRANEQLVGENLSLRQEVATRFQPSGIVGSSAAMVRVLATVELAAQGTSTVLLTGENGTGKEMIARVLHHSGKRRSGPFVSVNCGAIPETLLESELFGILSNVATDVRAREGRFVQANGGTLFLDEIGEMPIKQQVALLSVFSNREVTPVGGGKPIPVDVRIIAATNQDLRQQISEGRFREDLFYRLNVIPIEVPPLRDHKADIPSLARHFVEHFAKLQEREVPAMAHEFLAALMQSDWPGNVRELQNYVERIMAMTPGKTLHPTPLPRDLEERGSAVRLSRRRRLVDMVAELERRAIREALERAGGNQSQAARELGMTEQTLRYRLKKLSPEHVRQHSRTRKIRRTR